MLPILINTEKYITTNNKTSGQQKIFSISYRQMHLHSLFLLLIYLSVFINTEGQQTTSKESAIKWESNGKVSASLENYPLEKVLQLLSDQEKWQILVEPDLNLNVTTRFKNLSQAEALRRLLNDVNFVIIPSKTSQSRMLVYQTSSDNAVRKITPKIRSNKSDLTNKKDNAIIKNELLVTLNPKSGIDIEALARQLGAKIKGKIDGLDIYQLEFENESDAAKASAQLEQNDGVTSVDSNFAIEQPIALSPVNLPAPPLNLRPASADTDGVIVGLIDSSVQKKGTQVADFLLPEISLFDSTLNESNQVSHGTSMAETILRGLSASLEGSQETSVKILPVDVYGDSDNTSTFDVARGIQSAIEGGADIISLSLGSDHQNNLLKSVIQAGSNEGVLFLAAAGNEPTGLPVYPAAQTEVIGVTALNRNGQRVASYANNANFVEVAAPGVGVTVLNNQTYFGTGTSFSTAYTAGVAAGISSSQGLQMNQVRDAITKSMKPPTTGP